MISKNVLALMALVAAVLLAASALYSAIAGSASVTDGIKVIAAAGNVVAAWQLRKAGRPSTTYGLRAH